MANADLERDRVELHIPFLTFLKFFAAIVVGYLLYVLWPFLLVLFLALLVGVTLEPIVQFMTKRRTPRWVAITIVTFALIGTVAGTFALLVPALSTQVADFTQRLPELKEKLVAQVPEAGGLRHLVQQTLHHPPEAQKWMTHLLAAGQSAFGGLAGFFLLLILAVYFVVDGKSTYQWLLAYLSPDQRQKVSESSEAISKVIIAYIAGQFITSLLASIYVFIVCAAFKVPAALVLAVLAGVFDVLPVIGFFMALIPTLLLALTISPGTALTVSILYVVYHIIETYLLVPKIYGDRLRVSGLIVLVTLIMASTAAGVLGAIAILPIVASYPIIERIWLEKYVGRRAIEKHK